MSTHPITKPEPGMEKVGTTKQDAAVAIDAHKHRLIKMRDDLTHEIERLVDLQISLMKEDGDEE